ncbi:MAG TPA: hypothetical protein P5117_05800, partial [Spirochaetia bacterium]|nr:hypothetical protein [Spirochaetia bacterium]
MANIDTTQDAVNEFNQYVKPVSLWADAWKRLRRNKMAVLALWVVGFYFLLALSAPLLQSAGILHSYTEQIISHQNLRPSFRPAGELVIESLELRIAQLEENLASREEDSNSTYNMATGFDFAPAAEIEFDDGEVDEGEAALEEVTEEADDTYYGPTYSDSVVDELERSKAEVEALRGSIHTDPQHSKVYILGTDDLGRDMLARTIYGGRISIMIGIVGTLTAVLIGILIGSISGYVGGAID